MTYREEMEKVLKQANFTISINELDESNDVVKEIAGIVKSVAQTKNNTINVQSINKSHLNSLIRSYKQDVKKIKDIIEKVLLNNNYKIFVNQRDLDNVILFIISCNVPEGYLIKAISKIIENNKNYLIEEGYTLEKIEKDVLKEKESNKEENYKRATVICGTMLKDIKYGDLEYLSIFLKDILPSNDLIEKIIQEKVRFFDNIIIALRNKARTDVSDDLVEKIRHDMTVFEFPVDMIETTCYRVSKIQEKAKIKKEKENLVVAVEPTETQKIYKRNYKYVIPEEEKALRKSIAEYVDMYKLEVKKEYTYEEFLIILSKLIRLDYSESEINAFIMLTERMLPNIFNNEDKIAKVEFFYKEDELSYLHNMLNELNKASDEEEKAFWQESIDEELTRLLSSYRVKNRKFEKSIAQEILNIQLEQLKEIDNLYYNENIIDSFNPIIDKIKNDQNAEQLLAIQKNYEDIVSKGEMLSDEETQAITDQLFKIVQCHKYDYNKAFASYKRGI